MFIKLLKKLFTPKKQKVKKIIKKIVKKEIKEQETFFCSTHIKFKKSCPQCIQAL
tara:strand:+ start:250 stop:414 length:165 start_codon:yes stop_codon:yes gene_type:complete